ncbi:MAG: acyl-CoA dehydrogenase family protein [Pseudomonadota bacterium]
MDGASWRGPAIDAADDGDDARFVDAVRAFLDRALTPDLREAGRRTIGVHSDIAACRVWQARLHARGWAVPAWPVDWGGTGWSARRKFLFDRELALADAPILFAGGVRSLGPLLIEMGTPAQRDRYLGPIRRGEDLWAQGFSEPGAGSDLASLSTRAARRGDRYHIDGTKIWTTGAHLANRMFALVRTGEGGRPQEGLTFLLIDLPAAGLTIRPIIDIAGEHELNQVFFDDVVVPVSQRVGEENDGWAVAKRLMALARSNNTPAALVRRTLATARGLAREAGEALEPSVWRRLAGLAVELEAFEQLELACLPGARPRPGEQVAPSMLKLIGAELRQRIAEVACEAAGPRAALRLHALAPGDDALEPAARAAAAYFALRAATIYSGSSETQRNVIARALLA